MNIVLFLRKNLSLPKDYKYLIIGFLFYSQFALGQDPMTVLPSNITAFTASDGMPICIGNVFSNSEGRLYVSTCGPYQAEENTYLYEFDGYQKTYIPFHNLLGTTQAIPIYDGMNENGELFGHFSEEGTKRNEVFLLHPQRMQLQVFNLKEELGIDAFVNAFTYNPDHSYLIYASNDTSHFLVEWNESSFQLIKKFPKNGLGFDFFGVSRNSLLLQHENQIWFWEGQGQMIWQYDKTSKSLRRVGLDITGLPSSDGYVVYGINTDGENLFAALAPYEDHYRLQYYKLSQSGDNFVPLPIGKTQVGYYAFDIGHLFIDEIGNLLVRRGEVEEKMEWVLIDKETGQWYDYTYVFKQIEFGLPKARSKINTIKGKDFRKSFLAIGHGGVSFVELRPNQALKIVPTIGTRAMVELDDKILIKNERTEFFYELDLSTYRLNTLENSPSGCILKDNYSNLMDIHCDPDGNVYLPLGGNKNALLRYNPETETCTRLPVGISFERFIFINEVNIILVSKGVNELYSYNVSTQKLTPYKNKQGIIQFTAPVFQMRAFDNQFLWAATGDGLWRFDLTTGELVKPYPELQFQKGTIYFIDQAEDGILWLGTANFGLQLFDPNTGDLRSIDESNGLSNNTVVAILKDQKGVRWLNTYNGLNLISPNGKFLTKLYEEDGLANNEGNRFSSLKLKDGRLVFGSVTSSTLIQPEQAKEQLLLDDTLSIFLTEISYYDQERKIDTTRTQHLDRLLTLDLPAANRYLKLRVALSDFQKNDLNQFSYRIEGPENELSEWIYMGNQSELNLTNLPAGKYKLVIQGKNYRGRQTLTPLKIAIHAKEFFYKEPWFYVLIFLILSAFPILWLVRERFERQRLQRLVKERTLKIEQDKETIEAYAEQLKSLDEAKSRFFTNISHEFRTPLTVISGMADQILGPGKAKKLIQRNTHHLLLLINQILDLRKLESGRLELNFIQSDVVKYLRYILESFHSLAADKGVAVEFQSHVNEMIVDFDPEKLLRIVSNLVSNAVKFTPEGGKVLLQVKKSDLYYQFTIQDDGLGIPDEKIPFLFDRFYQVDGTMTRSGEGTGIGLTLVKELVELMKGTVQVSSQADMGSAFTIQLPIKNNAPIDVNLEKHLLSSNSVPQASPSPVNYAEGEGDALLPSLLLVEDSPDVMEYLITCLQGEYRLSFATDGQEGIDKALKEVPDIIISDVMMPHRDGFDLCNTLKLDERTSHIPIVLLTAKADTDSRITGLERGADAYLAKPFDRRELDVQLKNLLALRKRLQARYASLLSFPETADESLKQEDEFVIKIRQLVLDNMEEEGFGVSELCQKAAMSRTQLHNKIKSLTNNSTSQFIRSIRIGKAIELLLKSDLNVNEIAFEVGFTNRSYFSRIFTEQTGLSPNKYREHKALER